MNLKCKRENTPDSDNHHHLTSGWSRIRFGTAFCHGSCNLFLSVENTWSSSVIVVVGVLAPDTSVSTCLGVSPEAP